MSNGKDLSLIDSSGQANDNSGPQQPPARSNCVFSFLLALAILYTLYFGRDFFLPVFVAFFLALISLPLANQLSRWKVPHGVSAALVVIAVLSFIGIGSYQLSGPAMSWVDRSPQLARQVQLKFRSFIQTIEGARESTQKLEEITRLGEDGDEKAVVVKGPGLGEQLFSTARSTVIKFFTIVVLFFFLVARGRDIIQSLSAYRYTGGERYALGSGVPLNDILLQIQRELSTYLGTVTLVNLVLGAVTALAMMFLEMPNPVLWGAVAAILNYVPYIGPLVNILILAVVSLATFESPLRIIAPPLVFLCLQTLEGEFITPMILGNRLKTNPVVVFLFVLFWSWIWGIMGTLLALPILVTLKSISKNIDVSKTLGCWLR